MRPLGIPRKCVSRYWALILRNRDLLEGMGATGGGNGAESFTRICSVEEMGVYKEGEMDHSIPLGSTQWRGWGPQEEKMEHSILLGSTQWRGWGTQEGEMEHSVPLRSAQSLGDGNRVRQGHSR